jgi:hypothetical protein
VLLTRRRYLALSVAGLVVAGCKDSSGPAGRQLATNYALTSIDGRLPYTVYTSLNGDQIKVIGGRLQVMSRGRIMDVLRSQEFSATGQPGLVEVDSGVYAYRRTGDTLFIERTAEQPLAPYTDTAIVEDHNLLTVSRRLVKVSGIRLAPRHRVVYAGQ